MSVSARSLGLSVPVTEALDPKLWRERYAYGVLLGAMKREWTTVNRGGDPQRELTRVVEAIPDDTIRWHLRVAMSELETKLGVPLGVTICKATPVDEGLVVGRDYDREVPRRPYVVGDVENWWRIDAPAGCLSIQRVRAYWFGQKVWEFSDEKGNLDQVRLVHPGQGTVHLLPNNLAALVIAQDGRVGVFHTIYATRTTVPDFWAIDYTQGPVDKNTGQPGHIEAVLAHWVACVAAPPILNMASQAVSRGVSSSSVSLDGVSRSVSLQTSAMYGLNSALEKAYQDAEKRIDWRALRLYKKGLRVVSY